MDRNEDQKFIATYGRDKTFATGLEGSLENCDQMLFEWFVVSQFIAKKIRTPKLGGYEIHFSRKRPNKGDPTSGPRAAFLSSADSGSSTKAQDLSKAALIVQMVENQHNRQWRFQFPSEADAGAALTKLVNEMLRKRLTAD